jgi:hypothetical protein
MEDFIGIFYPPDDAVEYTFVDKNGNVITSYWCFLGEPGGPVYDTEELNDLGPGWEEIGYISEEDLDPTPQPDYHVTPMLYTGLLTLPPTGEFRIRPEDVTSTCGRTD